MPCLDLETLLGIPHIDPYRGFDISPDGTSVVFSGNRTGQWEIYEASLDDTGDCRQLTEGPGAKFGARYAPDGTRIAYVLDSDGSESYDACIVKRATRQHTNLTTGLQGALQPNLSWSPDSAKLAFVSQESGRFNTYITPVDGGSERLVLALPHPDWDVRWSPDGRHLAVCSETTSQDYGIFIVPATGGEWVQLAGEGGPINAQEPDWAPDGTRLAFTSDLRGSYDIGIYDLKSGEVSWVTHSECDDTAPCWGPRGDQLAFVRRKRTSTSLGVAAGGDTRTYQVSPGIHTVPRFTPDGEHLAFVFDNPRCPPDLWVLSLIDGEAHRVTDSALDGLSPERFTMPDEVSYPAMDGECVPALLYRPPGGSGPGPAVIVVHGGPNWLSQVTWSPEIQHYVSRGWLVLAPNYHGSIGYGRPWQLANRYDLGGIDTRDVVAGADYLVREGLADPDRIAITGRSHGGYLTMTCLTQYPDRWAGGSAVVPFLNWFTSHRNARRDLQHWDIENMGDPKENWDLWYERSPFFFLHQVEAPVQLICGGNDPRCPASESIQARDVLQELGKEVELVLYRHEGHEFLKNRNVIDAEKKRAAFLGRVLDA